MPTAERDAATIPREFVRHLKDQRAVARTDDGQELELLIQHPHLPWALHNKRFVGRTVSYSNNERLLWCVLTNGVSSRVDRANEPVSMPKKLLFSVDLADSEPTAAMGEKRGRESIRRCRSGTSDSAKARSPHMPLSPTTRVSGRQAG